MKLILLRRENIKTISTNHIFYKTLNESDCKRMCELHLLRRRARREIIGD